MSVYGHCGCRGGTASECRGALSECLSWGTVSECCGALSECLRALWVSWGHCERVSWGTERVSVVGYCERVLWGTVSECLRALSL